MTVFILPQFSGGGAERVFINILVGLYNKGHSVGVVVFDRKGPLLSNVPGDIPMYDLDTKTLVKSIIPLLQLILKIRPKVIISTFGYVNIPLLLFKRVFYKRTKLWIREANMPSISLPNNSYPNLMNFLYKMLYNRADKLFCTSVAMKKEFTCSFSVPDAIISILPNPVNIKELRLLASPIKRLYKGGNCYVASGRVTFQKGFDRLIDWFLSTDDHLSTLVILGDGPDKAGLIQKVKDLKMEDRIKFIGFCNNPWQWYAGADALLISSRWEGMPNSALESLACGTPVIATAESGGIDEIFTGRGKRYVTVSYTNNDFIRAMNSTPINISTTPRLSLLPDIYHLDAVISNFERYLNNIELK